MGEVSSDSVTTDANHSHQSRSRNLKRMLGVVLITISALMAYYLVVVYLGWQSGQALLVEKREQEFAAQIARQVELAREDIDAEKYALAQRRLEWVLERDPNHIGAHRLQQVAQSALNVVLTPATTVMAATLSPTPTPLPSPTPGLIEDPRSELQRIRRLAVNERWNEAVSALLIFRRQFPNYERRETDQLLFNAYIELGLQLVNGERVELGLFYLSQAEKLGNLPSEVIDYRLWAELYTQGIGFYGANWGAAATYFRDLCLAAPFYQNSCDLLQEILVNHGDQYAAAQDWCPARDLYQEARSYDGSQTLLQKLQQARDECLAATPTPSGSLTDTLPITGTQPASAPFAIPTSPPPFP